eukprot:g1341.t1
MQGSAKKCTPPVYELQTSSGLYPVRTSELVRLMLQGLDELGYSDTVKTLMAESGLRIHSSEIAEFRSSVLNGNWEHCIEILPKLRWRNVSMDLAKAHFLLLRQKYLELLEEGKVSEALLCLQTELNLFSLTKGKRKGENETREVSKGHKTEKNLYSSDNISNGEHGREDDNRCLLNKKRICDLSSLILCRNRAELFAQSGWSGISGKSREKLLANFYDLIEVNEIVPDGRLCVLLGQAMELQSSRSAYHNNCYPLYSLLRENKFTPPSFPKGVVAILEDHQDEVWHIAFSNSGLWLASCSKDGTCIIWDTTLCTTAKNIDSGNISIPVLHILRPDFSSGVDDREIVPCLFAAWSPNDSFIATCCEGGKVLIWDTETGKCVQSLEQHTSTVLAAAWLPDCKRLVTGGVDERICIWDISCTRISVSAEVTATASEGADESATSMPQEAVQSENEMRSSSTSSHSSLSSISPVSSTSPSESMQDFSNEVSGKNSHPFHEWFGVRVNDLCVSPNGKHVIVASSDKKIHLFDLTRLDQKSEIRIQESDPIMSMTLAADGRLLLLSIANNDIHAWDLEEKCLVQRFQGQRQSRYVIRTSIGGERQNLVASGSEDSQIYIWYRGNGRLLGVLPGHSATVSCVAWNGAGNERPTLASCSDDHTVRIWR